MRELQSMQSVCRSVRWNLISWRHLQKSMRLTWPWSAWTIRWLAVSWMCSRHRDCVYLDREKMRRFWKDRRHFPRIWWRNTTFRPQPMRLLPIHTRRWNTYRPLRCRSFWKQMVWHLEKVFWSVIRWKKHRQASRRSWRTRSLVLPVIRWSSRSSWQDARFRFFPSSMAIRSALWPPPRTTSGRWTAIRA